MSPAQLIALPSDDAAEEAARQLPRCPACGEPHNPAGVGALVCHRCYKTKTPTGHKPLKHSGQGFRAWLEQAAPF